MSFEVSAIDIILAVEVTVLIVLQISGDKSTKKKAFLAEAFKLRLRRLLPYLAGLFPMVFGSIILAWVGWLIWYDTTAWSKDIGLILFGSRTTEPIGLGIGMKVFDYLLIGLALPLLGLFIFLRRRISFARA